jgi:hypothetical protein
VSKLPGRMCVPHIRDTCCWLFALASECVLRACAFHQAWFKRQAELIQSQPKDAGGLLRRDAMNTVARLEGFATLLWKMYPNPVAVAMTVKWEQQLLNAEAQLHARPGVTPNEGGAAKWVR